MRERDRDREVLEGKRTERDSKREAKAHTGKDVYSEKEKKRDSAERWKDRERETARAREREAEKESKPVVMHTCIAVPVIQTSFKVSLRCLCRP